MIDFSNLLIDNDDDVIDPREIFMTLNRDKRFNFPRDIQTEVLNAWFDVRTRSDIIIKLNVGSGKTVVGLLILQSSLNEKLGPCVYICPNNQLVNQVMNEAGLLGIDVTDEPRNSGFLAGERICITTIHKVFNGRSVFGVGSKGVKIGIGSLVVDDVHSCIAAVSKQFRISLPNTHPAYVKIFNLVAEDLKRQNHASYLQLRDGDPQSMMEVPFWTWQKKADEITEILHEHRETDELIFTYSLLSEIVSQCRCIFGAEWLEIEPTCPPTDQVRAFSKASRRIYMTATLSDDSVLVTHFGVDANVLENPIVPVSSQFIGERMILMPQEINPNIELSEIRNLLIELSKKENVVIIVPSSAAADTWQDDAAQVLMSENIVEGVKKLSAGHVGLTVLVNRYDGIDLPDNACRVLAIIGLPEESSFCERSDMAVMTNSENALRRQVQRIEQGMGRGVRSNDDYCVVLLCGAKLTSRIRSRKGTDMLMPATQAQMDLTNRLAKQLANSSIEELHDVISRCLKRDPEWVTVSKKSLLKIEPDKGLKLYKWAVSLRTAFDKVRQHDYVGATNSLQMVIDKTNDRDLKAWLTVRLAEVTHPFDPAQAQKILVSAQKSNSGVLKPIKGVTYQKLRPATREQAAEAQQFHNERFLEAVDRLLVTKELLDDLTFDPGHTDEFENAMASIAYMLGIGSQRPEQQLGEGPDNLWCFPGGEFIVIECKSGATSSQGISKKDLGQLEQSITWFNNKYTGSASMTPIMVHPLKKSGPGATKISGACVITQTELTKLKDAFENFNKSLGDENILNDVKRISELLSEHKFTSKAFISNYTVPMKSK